jgi:hypothetical protein
VEGEWQMGLKARNRVSPANVLAVDYEYATINYYVEGSRNELGEPEHTLMQRVTNVRCSIDPLTRAPAYITRSGLREVLQQGIVEASVFIMTLSADATIESGDIVTDYDGTDYEVIHVINWYTHKEAFLRKMN